MMSRPLLRTWWGVYLPNDEASGDMPSPQRDYDRACEVRDEIGTIDGRGAQILVLGDEPDRTAIRSENDVVVIVRWRAAESSDVLEAALQQLISSLPFERAGTFHTLPGEHLLFDSACAGWDASESITCTLPHATYSMESAMLRDSGTEALIHRLKPLR